jgi:VWFA-related protein
MRTFRRSGPAGSTSRSTPPPAVTLGSPVAAGNPVALAALVALVVLNGIAGALLGAPAAAAEAAKAPQAPPTSQTTAGRPTPPTGPSGTPAAKGSNDDFIETVTVNVVNVEVYVSDKNGKVSGLDKKDFEVQEDGRPMAITNFLAVDKGKTVIGEEAPPPLAPGEKAPPVLPAGYDRTPVPEDQRLRLIVYIDNYNLKPFDRNRVMRELRIFLDQKLHRDDQVMLVTYDRSMHIRHPFTTDTSLINAQLLEIEKISAQGVHQESDRREVLKNIEDSSSGSQAMDFARAYAGAAFNDLSFSIDAMKNLVSSLAGMPGRKAIVYVSDGLPMIAGEDVFYDIQSKYPGTSILSSNSEFDASRRFDELTSQANANRVTFYTIDAAGLRSFSATSAENATAGQGVYIDSINISNVQSPLMMIAEKTGGVAVINSNTYTEQLNNIADDFNSFYSLGYTPPHYGDGRYHKITIKVKRKGVKVRYREGYRDKSIESRMSDGTLAALNFPFQSNPIGLTLEFGKPTERKDGLFLVPVSVKIPLGKLALVPHEAGNSEAKVRLFIGAMDPDGGTSEVQQVPVPIRVPEAEVAKLGGKHFLYTVSLLMRGGSQKVAVGLRDDVGAQDSYVSGDLFVGH